RTVQTQFLALETFPLIIRLNTIFHFIKTLKKTFLDSFYGTKTIFFCAVMTPRTVTESLEILLEQGLINNYVYLLTWDILLKLEKYFPSSICQGEEGACLQWAGNDLL